jgi:3-hydroxyacyl-[acyl-carrier-protein] dehydratase
MKSRLTPHGPGFSFIDRFERTDVAAGRAWKTLDANAPFFADHFPNRPLMPAVLLAECAAQAAGTLWMSAEGNDPESPLFLASIDHFRILGPVGPGENIYTEVRLIKEFGILAQFEAECLVNHRAVARGCFVLSRQVGG